MKKTIRHYFPGGNTPLGFYSFYENIMFQQEAERIFCIKGGPGTGKSTLMKEIAGIFETKGSSIDYLWCSGDPDSLDGVVIIDKKVAIVDGTSPHVVDPQNPGAVDEIINLGECWDEHVLRENRKEIITLNYDMSSAYRTAYMHLKEASSVLNRMEENISLSDVKPLNAILETEIKAGFDTSKSKGGNKTFFGSAITYKGLVNTIDNLKESIEEPVVIKVPIGFRFENVIKKKAEIVEALGHKITKFNCSMNPHKIEHFIANDCSTGLFIYNDYHKFEINDKAKIIDLNQYAVFKDEDAYNNDKTEFDNSINNAVESLGEAKSLHDLLEEYYIKAMDFVMLENIKEKMIYKLESISY